MLSIVIVYMYHISLIFSRETGQMIQLSRNFVHVHMFNQLVRSQIFGSYENSSIPISDISDISKPFNHA